MTKNSLGKTVCYPRMRSYLEMTITDYSITYRECLWSGWHILYSNCFLTFLIVPLFCCRRRCSRGRGRHCCCRRCCGSCGGSCRCCDSSSCCCSCCCGGGVLTLDQAGEGRYLGHHVVHIDGVLVDGAGSGGGEPVLDVVDDGPGLVGGGGCLPLLYPLKGVVRNQGLLR